jgi:hypothetical protein
MATTSPLDTKALATIALLMDRRETWSVITYGDLAKKLRHAQQGLTQILDRVGAWCFSMRKESLAMLVIGASGEPSDGMFRAIPSDPNPVTRKNYELRRLQLWRENWSDVSLPTPDEIATAYAEAHRQSETETVPAQR